ncbi:MAG TPA: acetoin utilization protein [Rhodospirillaceae bacterium]|nr:acetoin utilization protein [Rhodospirillaceae bacterium]MAX60924.1 acetoin utilization protein [Rhodospirillaceae bacterium]MAX65246.1 acetoin utilization protein [Rhodospirillaceae bacterium]MBB55661.1 acetoin utilization protein [Rhodospirillaceae bacterium]HAE03987.1 acetoin utilization protein [Rhodospirillaceae bacterium]|tara:strand:- start:24932 stop:25864 length:933 start_codon:yes stop_codon:yes gene_type:complete
MATKTLLFTHPACAGHDMGEGHPEQPARLAAVLSALEGPDFQDLERREAPETTRDRILLMHPPAYVDGLMAAFPTEGRVQIDADTAVSAGSREAAFRAVGGVVAAVDAVMKGEAKHAFCAVRPPGHHAEPDQTMGFCLFNNIAIGAAHARDVYHLQRVAVIDFDVHHGNGTQAMFENEPMFFYGSTHQMPLYPGTGRPSETGIADNIVNVALPPMGGSAEFRKAFQDVVLPKLDAFGPELLMISAGFDAHRDDPLAQENLDEDDFVWVTQELLKIADKHCEGRVVSALEGGYNLDALGRSAAAHVRVLMA